MKKYLLLLSFIVITYSCYSQCPGTSGQVRWQYWENIYSPDGSRHFESLIEDDTYPYGPDEVRILNSLTTPYNYNNRFSAVIRGFISVPTSGSVTFNLTGDDYTVFLLSSDATSANLDTAAYVLEWSGSEEHNKYSEQTSDAINMVADQLYYFEMYNEESSGGDHMNLYWQRPYVTDSTWTLVTSPFLTDICDDLCPKKGTPCDDSNASTYNDLEDGNCHCAGTPDTTGLHVGDRGVLDAYFYDNTGNGNISELSASSNFPSMPDRMIKQRTGLYVYDWDDNNSNYGCHIQGYFTVPVTGTYDFNLTGSRNVEFRFNDAGPTETTNQVVSIRWGSERWDHDDDVSQTATGISLNSNTFYYFEFTQAVNGWDHFNVFWKVPGHVDDEWHMIPETHFYDYTNESACIPQGTTCDDGDPLTANDQMNDSCDCIGTECTPFMDCDDPAADLITYDYCDISNELGNRADDAWLSCDAGTNPYLNARSGHHWIHYDLGIPYVIKTSRVWNYNVSGDENLGFQNVVVDYSEDGINWTQLGTYNWTLANGDNTYTGFEGPDFGSVTARYIMITSMDAGSCRGISKVTFTAEGCLGKGQECDDGDMATVGDHFDESCNCVGYSENQINCGRDTLYLNQSDITDNTYHAMMALMSGGTVLNSGDVNYKAGTEIILEAGFEIQTGSTLTAEIEDCMNTAIAVVPIKQISKHLEEKVKPEESIKVYTTHGSTVQTIRLFLPDETDVSLSIVNIDKDLVMPLISHHYANPGDHYKRIQTKKLIPGIYMIKMTTDRGEYLEKMVVL